MLKKQRWTRRWPKYPADFKRKVAQQYEAGGYTYQRLAEAHGLEFVEQLGHWVRQYRQRAAAERANQADIEASMTKKKTTKPLAAEPAPGAEASSVAALQAQLAALEKELAYKELKIEALNTLIDVAQTELGVDIRKKSGAKPSKK